MTQRRMTHSSGENEDSGEERARRRFPNSYRRLPSFFCIYALLGDCEKCSKGKSVQTDVRLHSGHA